MRRELQQRGRAGDEPPLAWVGREAELLQRDGAQNRTTAGRPRPEHRRSLVHVQTDAHLAHAVGDEVAARQPRALLVRRREAKACDQLWRKQDVGRASVDEQFGVDRSVAMLGWMSVARTANVLMRAPYTASRGLGMSKNGDSGHADVSSTVSRSNAAASSARV
jgi:hypothetical protein